MLKRLLSFLFCAAVLLCAAPSACAASPFAPAAFFLDDLSMPAGVQFAADPAYDEERGLLTFTIDTGKTNWDQVVTSAYTGMGGEVVFSGTLKNPYGSDSDYLVIHSWQATDSELLEDIAQDFWSGSDAGDCTWRWPLGTYDPDKQLFIPRDVRNDPYSVLVGWDDGRELRRLLIEVRFDSAAPQPACMSLLPEDCIKPDKAVVKDLGPGYVRYERAPAVDPISTRIKLPDAALPGEDTSGWSTVFRHDGSVIDVGMPDADGYYSISTGSAQAKPDVWDFTCMVEQRDGEQNLRALYTFTISIVQGNPALFPTYISALTPFAQDDASRLSLRTTASVPGLSVSYSGGHLRFEVDKDAFDPAAPADLAGLHAHLALTPPDGATHMGFSGFGGPNIYGFQGDAVPPVQVVEEIDWETFDEGYAFFREVPYERGSRSYFTSPLDYTGQYAGSVALYYWFDHEPNGPNDTDFLGVEYIARTYDPVTIETSTPVVEDESELPPQDAGKPFIVIQDKGTNQHTFFARMYPTGEYRHYYELKVMNKNGKEVPLNNAECRLYLPYPAGYDETNAHLLNIAVHHYNKQGDRVQEYYSLDNGALSITENGLCITVSKLSPFTVEWSPAVDAALPGTGDSSILPLWALLLAACACALFVTRRGRHA